MSLTLSLGELVLPAEGTPAAEDCAEATVEYFELGDPIPSDGLYQNAGGCMSAMPADFRGFSRGAEVSPEVFPLLEERYVGDGRLRRVERRFASAPDADPVVPESFAWDEAAQDYCWFSTFTDGTVACLPANVRVVSNDFPLFADAECTEGLIPNGGCDPSEYAYEFVDGGECEGAIGPFYEIGEKFTGTTHYMRTPTGCEEQMGGDDLFRIAEVSPADVLAVVTEEIR